MHRIFSRAVRAEREVNTDRRKGFVYLFARHVSCIYTSRERERGAIFILAGAAVRGERARVRSE